MTLGRGWAVMDALRDSAGLDVGSRMAADASAQAWSGCHPAALDREQAEGPDRGV
jgi:hypothetical protein